MEKNTHDYTRLFIVLFVIQIIFTAFFIGLFVNLVDISNDISKLLEATECAACHTENTAPSSEPENDFTEPTEVTESVPEVTEETIDEPDIEETEPSTETETEQETKTITETEPEPVDDDTHEFDPYELEMLACVIYQETGGDMHCDDCRRRVADVVLNRINDSRFPDTMYEVLTEKDQYGRFHKTGIVWPSRHTDPDEAHAVDRAYHIAKEVLNGYHSDLYGNGYVWQASFTQSNDNIYCCGHYFGR